MIKNGRFIQAQANEGFSGFFDTYLKSAETSIKSTAQTYLPEKVYVAAEKYAETKALDQVKTLGTKLVSEQAAKYAARDDVQNNAITGGVQAAAAQVSNQLIAAKNIYKTQGITGIYKAYKTPILVTGGVLSLLFFRGFITAAMKRKK